MTPDALATLITDPTRADVLSREDLPEILGQVERLRALLWIRLSSPSLDSGTPWEAPNQEEGDQLLNAKEVAGILGTDDRYVYRHADEWSFTRRLSAGTIRFSRAGLHRWIEQRST